MSYQIGQIVKQNISNFMTNLPFHAPTGEDVLRTAGFANKIFTDYSIELDSGYFEANQTYYLRFSIKRIESDDERFKLTEYRNENMADDPRVMNIKLELFKNSGSQTGGVHQLGTYQVIQSSIVIEPYILDSNGVALNTPEASFEVVFTPNDNYRFLGFVLSRSNYDYFKAVDLTQDYQTLDPNAKPRDDVRTNINFENKDEDPNNEKGDLSLIVDILPKGTISYVDKIGVQTRPGTLVCINREPFRVGRSGTLEINNGVPISFFGIVAPNGSDTNNIDKFILDYAWNE